jgi:hypothetical protein
MNDITAKKVPSKLEIKLRLMIIKTMNMDLTIKPTFLAVTLKKLMIK